MTIAESSRQPGDTNQEVARLRAHLQDAGRFHTRLLDAVQEAVIATDLSGRVLYWNRFAEQLYGWTAEEALGRNVIELKAADSAEVDAEQVMTELRAGRAWSGEMVLKRRDGTTFPAHVSDGPILDDDGRLVGIVGISYDVTPRKVAEQKQALLIRELHHRVKNTLATVQAIMGTTARSAQSLDEFQQAFTGRVAALARIHSLLTDDQAQAVSFLEMLKAELDAFGAGQSGRVLLDGPTVLLPSDIAVPLGMAIHELASNAIRYGALGAEDGRVNVRWKQSDGNGRQTLSWTWNEHDGPQVESPMREGFGTRLLRRLLTAQTGAEVQVDFAPDGLKVAVDVPLPDR